MNLTVGQRVKLYGRHHYPTSEEIAEVVKVGRKLVTIKWGDSDWQQAQYRMDTGRDNGDGNSWFKTLEQDASDNQRREAERYLRENGVDIIYRCTLTNPQIEELAGIVKHMLSEKPADYDSEVKGASE